MIPEYRMKVVIKRFKSIKEASLDLNRINLIIGPPETGKSNLLEAFSILTILGQLKNYEDAGIVRRRSAGEELWNLDDLSSIFKLMTRIKEGKELFFSYLTEEPVEIELGRNKIEFTYNNEEKTVDISLNGNKMLHIDSYFNMRSGLKREDLENLDIERVMFYRYSEWNPVEWGDFLLPPHGPNLMHIIEVDERVRSLSSNILDDLGLKLVFDLPTGEISFYRFEGGIGLKMRYHLLSDTAKRTLFHLVALETNENSTILMEEPEVHSFPFYTKLLAERIAINKSNRFIITTHNPYFLETFVDKVPENELSIYLSATRGIRSEYKPIDVGKVKEIIAEGADVFLELGKGD